MNQLLKEFLAVVASGMKGKNSVIESLEYLEIARLAGTSAMRKK